MPRLGAKVLGSTQESCGEPYQSAETSAREQVERGGGRHHLTAAIGAFLDLDLALGKPARADHDRSRRTRDYTEHLRPEGREARRQAGQHRHRNYTDGKRPMENREPAKRQLALCAISALGHNRT